MVVTQFNFCHVFGLSAETTEAMPLFIEDGEDLSIGFFEGFVINLPFIKILLGRLIEKPPED
jgi:hypothetical protein